MSIGVLGAIGCVPLNSVPPCRLLTLRNVTVFRWLLSGSAKPKSPAPVGAAWSVYEIGLLLYVVPSVMAIVGSVAVGATSTAWTVMDSVRVLASKSAPIWPPVCKPLSWTRYWIWPVAVLLVVGTKNSLLAIAAVLSPRSVTGIVSGKLPEVCL